MHAHTSDAIHRAIQVVGDTWTLRILRELFRGARRFGEFATRLGISKAVLSNRLDRLVDQDLLHRVVESGKHPEYRLTERGLDLWSLMLAMWLWSTECDSGPASTLEGVDLPRPLPTHTRCGHTMLPEMRCRHCHERVTLAQTESAGRGLTGPARDQAATEGAVRSGFRRAPRSLPEPHMPQMTGTLPRVIGDRWNCALIAAACAGVRLFSEFERALQIPPSLLTHRLGELQELGLLQRETYAGSRGAYELTAIGSALYPTILELRRWGERWIEPDEASIVRHSPCGRVLSAVWCCGHCRHELARTDLRFEPDI